MLLHSDTLSRLHIKQISLCSSPLCCLLSGEATNTNLVFCLNRPALQPMIYGTRSKHTNYFYITIVVTLLVHISKYITGYHRNHIKNSKLYTVQKFFILQSVNLLYCLLTYQTLLHVTIETI